MRYVKICEQYVPVEQNIIDLLLKYNASPVLSTSEEDLFRRFLGYVRSMRCSNCRTRCASVNVVINPVVSRTEELDMLVLEEDSK